jgi:predicted oxidoreductase
VTLVDRDTPERLGGLALWAFGGMALVGTPLQARMGIPDTPELALRDWLRFGELDPADTWPLPGRATTSSIRVPRYTTGCCGRASASCRR